MTYTAPRTWSACEVVTAALMNTHVRDNFLQTFPALVTTKGDSVWATGANAGQRLAVGGDGTVIVANSACNAGVQWDVKALFVAPANPEVGIGTTSPSAILDVCSGADATGGSGGHIAIQFWNGGFRHFIKTYHQGNATTQNGFEFWLNSSSSSTGSTCPGDGSNKVGGFYGTAASGGMLGIGACWQNINSKMTYGVNISSSAGDEMVTLKDSTLAHGMTALSETNSFGTMTELTIGGGGLNITGYSASIVTDAVHITGYTGLGSTVKNNGAGAIINLNSGCKNGTSATFAGSTSNLVAISNATCVRFIFQGGGDLYADSSLTASAFDSHDDVQLVRALEVERQPGTVIRDQFDSWLKYSRKDLEAAEIAVFNDPAEGGDGSVFVNVMGLQRLHSGAIWQMHKHQRQLEDRITQLERLLIGPPKAGAT